MKSSIYDILVVGGGAAGMLAAITAAQTERSVLLIERNDRLGKKLRITGKGRCNITNDCSVRDVIDNIPTGGRFLQSAVTRFPPREVMALFETLGVPLKVERGGRVFPQSDKAADVADALRRCMDELGVVQKRGRVLEVLHESGVVRGVSCGDGEFYACAVIICTGGVSYPATGSTGDGYTMAQKLGHTLAPVRASLVPLEAEPELCGKMAGLTLKNVRLTILQEGMKKPVYTDFGELLFTHFGLSGPIVLSASAHMRDWGRAKYIASIDLKPALDEKKLDLRILRDFEKLSNRDFANALGGLLNRLMIPVVIEKSGISPDTKVHSVTREQRLRLLRLIKDFRINIEKPRPVDEAVITSGGVSLREINPKTMESKLIKGLYFAGEIIDADAYTGGFNLQIAWSTARAAGYAASNIQGEGDLYGGA